MNLPVSNLSQAVEREEDLFDIGYFANVLFTNRWLILTVASLVFLAGFFYAISSPSVYQANILIQVEDNAPGANSALANLSSVFNLKTGPTAEMEILRSRLVIGRAIDNAGWAISAQPKYLPLLGIWSARYKLNNMYPSWIKESSFATGGENISISKFILPEVLEDLTFLVTIQANNRYRLRQEERGIDIIGSVGVSLKTQTKYGAIELLVGSVKANEGKEFRLRRTSRLKLIQDLQNSLTISEQGKQSGIIAASLEGNMPTETVYILNEIGKEYIRQNVERKSEEAEKSLVFLEKQLPELKQRLEESESRYNLLRNVRGTVDLDEEARSVLQQSALLKTRIVDLMQRKDELLTRFQEENPLVQGVSQQIKTANSELESLTSRIRKMPTMQQDVLRLTREVKVNTDLYTSLLNSAQQLRLVRASRVGNARLLDIAVTPLQPIRPNRKIIIGVAALIGLGVGIMVAFIRKNWFKIIDCPNDIERTLGLPLFATIRYHRCKKYRTSTLAAYQIANQLLIDAETQRYAVIEDLRNLRALLQSSVKGCRSNIILLAGATDDTDTSFISANIAASLGSSGKKILLIDADSTNSALSKYFRVEKTTGLTDFLNLQVALSQCISKKVKPNVDLVQAGSSVFSLADFLASDKFGIFLDSIKTEYDYVLIQTAPVLVSSDAIVISQHSALNLCIVRNKINRLKDIEIATNRFLLAGVGIPNFVFNDMA